MTPVSDERAEAERATSACRALLALPPARSGLDKRRREALTLALSRLESGNDLTAALAAVREALSLPP